MKGEVKVSILLLGAMLISFLLVPEGFLGTSDLASMARTAVVRLLGGAWRTAEGPSTFSMNSELLEQNQRLSQLLSLRGRLSGSTAVATVIRREPEAWWLSIWVRFRLTSEMPEGSALVMTPEGLIGVLEASKISSLGSSEGLDEDEEFLGQVQLLTAPTTQLAVNVGGVLTPYLLEGTGGPRFRLRPLERDKVAVSSRGTLVSTAGSGHLFVEGLPVAVIEDERGEMAETLLRATPGQVLLWWH